MDVSPNEYEQHFFTKYSFLKNLIAGGCCGLAVDGFLFPIDTCKTRLQSENGFWKAGGFRDIYNGILPVIAASVPIAAIFFCVYEAIKLIFSGFTDAGTVELFFYSFLINSIAASCGEMCAGLIRVPIEIVKQKRQVSEIQYRAIDILMHAYKSEGIFNGIYRGYSITIMRDIPFSMIQYPLWELLKALFVLIHGYPAGVFIDACFGSVAGAVASAITTPLDVAKTRIQLADIESNSDYRVEHRSPWRIWRQLYKQKGVAGLFGGFVPRVLWTTIGGFIWFGTYSLVSELLESV